MMAAVTPKKHVQIYPLKLSQPMGATLAAMGIGNAIALAHGAVGCSSLTKIFFTRHFCDPIAIRTTAVSEIAAVLDGGDDTVSKAVENILPKIKPDLFCLFSTGMTSLKGDDLRRIAEGIDFPMVYAETPDYAGGLESGWAAMTSAFVDQLMQPAAHTRTDKALVLPHVSLQPLEVEAIKDLLEEFGYEVHALPDVSTSLDGHLGSNQSLLSQGGISARQIRELGDVGLVVSVGASMAPVAEAVLAKAPKALHLHLSGVMGLQATDAFITRLLDLTGKLPGKRTRRWRLRHQDALIDAHFSVGRKRFILAGEPDRMVDMAAAIAEAGGTIAAIVAATPSKALDHTVAETVMVGDLDDVEGMIDQCDVLVTNYHGERIVRRHGKVIVLRGYPILEQIGVQQTVDALYQGGTRFLVEVANAIITDHANRHDGH